MPRTCKYLPALRFPLIVGASVVAAQPSRAAVVYPMIYQENGPYVIALINTQQWDHSLLASNTSDAIQATSYANKPSSLVLACNVAAKTLVLQSFKTGVINQNEISVMDTNRKITTDHGPFEVDNDKNAIQQTAKSGDPAWSNMVTFYQTVRSASYWAVEPIFAPYTDPTDAVGRVLQKCGVDTPLRADRLEPAPQVAQPPVDQISEGFPAWADADIKKCVANTAFHTDGCWPKFTWATASTAPPPAMPMQNNVVLGSIGDALAGNLETECNLRASLAHVEQEGRVGEVSLHQQTAIYDECRRS